MSPSNRWRVVAAVVALTISAGGAGPSIAAEWSLLGPSLSADPLGWASSPAIAGAPDGALYAAWAQHTNPDVWQHSGIYVKRWVSGAWQSLGGRIGHGRQRKGDTWAEGYAPALAVVEGRPYVAWYEGGGYGWGTIDGVFLSSSVFVAHWDGAQWVKDTNATIPNGALNTVPGAAARSPRLALANGSLHAAWIETLKNYNVIVVKRLDSGQWEQVGGEIAAGPPAPGTRIVDVALAEVDGLPHVAWSEYRRSGAGRPGLVHVARFEGTAWTRLGSPLNVLPEGNANHLALAAQGRTPYVAWQERTLAGNNQIYVKFWDGSQWAAAGGSLNADSARGEAGRPALIADDNRLWLAWAEGNPGQRSLLRLRSFSAGGWSEATSPLNASQGSGAADGPGLSWARGNPVLIWAEKDPPPATKQIYVRMLR